MQSYTARAVVDETNAAQPGSTVTVYDTGTLNLSALFEDAAAVTPLANPFTLGDTTNLFTFFAADGVYDVTISKVGATTYTIPAVQLLAIP